MTAERSDKTIYARYKPTRKSRRQLDECIGDLIHDDLKGHDRVSIAKFESRQFKRGLDEGEEPFPVVAKVGPYVVSKFFALV